LLKFQTWFLAHIINSSPRKLAVLLRLKK